MASFVFVRERTGIPCHDGSLSVPYSQHGNQTLQAMWTEIPGQPIGAPENRLFVKFLCVVEQSDEHDEIGIWSEVKPAIIKDYAAAYAKILDRTRRESAPSLRWIYAPSLRWIYIDAHAGPGYHLSKKKRSKAAH